MGEKREDYTWKVLVGQAQKWSIALLPTFYSQNANIWPHQTAREAKEESVHPKGKEMGLVSLFLPCLT